MRKCVVSVRYGGPMLEDIIWFEKICEGPAETYEAVKAIISHNKLMFPDQKSTMNDYFYTVNQIFAGVLNASENHIFKIEKIDN